MRVLEMLARSHALVSQVCHDMGEELTSQRRRYRACITKVVVFIFVYVILFSTYLFVFDF